MSGWLCKECFVLDDEALELHIQAHARSVPWSYDEVKQAIMELREQYRHCFACQDRIDRDLTPVPIVPFRNGHQTTAEAFAAFGEAWSRLVGEVNTLVKPFVDQAARYLEPPANVMDRALQARKNRNTGPARPSAAAARRPRRHK